MTRWFLVLLLAPACAGDRDSDARHLSAEDGVSFARVPGWDISRERATILLKGPGPATIAIRTIPRDGWSEPRNQTNVFPAVATSLRALPKARVSGPTHLETAAYRAVAFDVEFTPAGRTRPRYQRRHVTLLAENHVIHVFMVAPLGQLDSSRRDFDTVVTSIREEG
jgi:hypothetical protein